MIGKASAAADQDKAREALPVMMAVGQECSEVRVVSALTSIQALKSASNDVIYDA
ncbi:hypothetical protein [Paramesorhizobium deserti]|uniref:hypothetical protein n=1 Tax=Paramesorhizobium deserti TaxID=1494590 RepID=UPI00137B6989|nr:hypothetical protein [Paramesorhizobium deserti]